RIYGPDLDVLRDKANAVRAVIEGSDGRGAVPGVIELKVEPQLLVPQLELDFLLDRLKAYNLTAAQVADDVTARLGGTKVNEVHRDERPCADAVGAARGGRRQQSGLSDLEPALPGGKGTVRLRDVARLTHPRAPNTFRHYKTKRCIDVSCNVKPG